MNFDFGLILSDAFCIKTTHYAVLQIRKGNGGNLEIIYHIFSLKIFCDPSIEPSRRDGSNEGSQNMFVIRTVSSRRFL